MIIVNFAVFIAIGLGSVLLNEFVAGLAFRRGWLYKMLGSILVFIEVLALFIGFGMFVMAFNGYPSWIWGALFFLAPSICLAYSLLRWAVYGRRQDEAWWEQYTKTRKHLRRAIGILEAQNFTIHEVSEDYYIVSHPNPEVQTLRGSIDALGLISIAERLEPLLLHAELQGKPTHEVVINRSYILN